jgi:phosphoglucomutase/phosphomannomutase
MFRAVGEAAGVRVIDNLLVGFKYIGRTIDDFGAKNFLFGAEESLGYLAGDYCRDKDAAIAALYVMGLVSELKSEGRTLADELDRLYVKHGYFAESQRSLELAGAQGRSRIEELLAELRDHPPAELAGIRLASLRDYRKNEVRRLPGTETTGLLKGDRGDLLIVASAEGPLEFSFAIRPSGTEPKVKFYFFARARADASQPLAALKSATNTAFSTFQDAVMRWAGERLSSAPRSAESAKTP